MAASFSDSPLLTPSDWETVASQGAQGPQLSEMLAACSGLGEEGG